jgi:hypothetical protein
MMNKMILWLLISISILMLFSEAYLDISSLFHWFS